MQSNIDLLKLGENPKAEELQTLLRKTSQMEKPEQRYLAHAILQSILFSMEQYCDITLQVTENCINDGPTDKPIEVKSLIKCMQAKNANPFSTMRIQPETLYFMRYNGYNDLIQDNRYSQGEYPNFNTYETIYTNALEGIAQGNLDIFSSLPQEIQNVVGKYKGVLLDIVQRNRNVLQRTAEIDEDILRLSLLTRIKESTTTSAELTTILKAVNNISNEGWKCDLMLLIAKHPNHTEEIHNDILEAAKTFSHKQFKSATLSVIAQQDSTTSNTLTKIFSIAQTLNGDFDKNMIFAYLAGNPNLSEEIRDAILSIAMNSSEPYSGIFIALAKNNINQIFQIVKTFEDNACKASVFSGLIKNFNLTEEMKYDILQETKTIQDIAWKASLLSDFIRKFNLTEEMKYDILQETKAFFNSGYKPRVFSSLIKYSNLTEKMQYEIFEQIQTMHFSDKAEVFSSFVAKNNINEKMKHDILEQTKALMDNGCYKAKVFIEFIKNDTLPKNNKFIELIQLIDSNYDKRLLLNEMLFATYNANINNKEGFNNRLQAYLPIAPANVDKAFEAMQNVSNSKELTLDNKQTLMYNQPIWKEIIDNIYNSQNNSNTFANLMQNQRSQPTLNTHYR